MCIRDRRSPYIAGMKLSQHIRRLNETFVSKPKSSSTHVRKPPSVSLTADMVEDELMDAEFTVLNTGKVHLKR